MRWTITILLCLAAAAAVAGALRWIDRGAWDGSTSRMATAPLLAARATDPDAIDEIAMVRRGSTPWRWRRDGDTWIELEPSGLPVAPFALRELLLAVRNLTPSRWVALDGPEGEIIRRNLELDPPEATLRLRRGQEDTVLELGRLGLAGRAFVQVGAASDAPSQPASVAVVGQELHTILLGQDLSSWRLRSLFPQAGVETTSIEYTAGDSTLRLVRRGGRWWMEAPVKTRADPTAMETYLAALARAECSGFAGDADSDESLAQHGLLPPAASIAVSAGDGPASRSRRVLVGRTMAIGGGDRFGMLEGHPVLLALSPTTLQALFAAPAALIDPAACDVLAADVKRVRIEGPEGEFSVERDLDRWRSPQADGGQADTRAIDEFFRRLTEVRATSVNLRPIPRELLVGRIDLIGFDGTVLASIEVGADPAGSQIALDSGDGVARIFPASMAPGLTKAALGIVPK